MSYLRRLLGNEERVLFSTHQHWTAFIGNTWHLFVLFVLGLAVAVFLNLLPGVNLSVRSLAERLPAEQQWLVRIGLVVVLLGYQTAALLIRYCQWQAEQYTVTNLRVIQLTGILSKRVLDSSLEKVNDVLLEQSVFGRMLNYGNLEILTASELAVNKLRRLARPLAFKAAMLNAKQELEGGGREGREDTAKLIADLADLRDRGILTEAEFQAKKGHLLGEL